VTGGLAGTNVANETRNMRFRKKCVAFHSDTLRISCALQSARVARAQHGQRLHIGKNKSLLPLEEQRELASVFGEFMPISKDY
jgi:hypothetical protein